MSNRGWLLAILAMAGVFLGSSNSRADFIIDAFDNNGLGGGGAQGPKSSSSINSPDHALVTQLTALGGSRLLWVNNLNGNGPVSVSVNLAGDGNFSYTPGASTQGRGFVAWDSRQGLPLPANLDPYAEVNPAGLGGVNLVTIGTGNNDAVQVVVESNGGVNVLLRAYTDASHYSDLDRKSTRLNSSHIQKSRMPSSA